MKTPQLILASSLFMAMSGVAQAEACYQLSPFTDVIRVSMHQDIGSIGDNHIDVFGNWIAKGNYTLPSSGAMELDAGSRTVKRIGIVGTNITSGFNGNLICALDGIPKGAWQLQCSGGTAGNFQNSGNPLTPVNCNTVSISSPTEAGKAAGIK